MSEQVRLEEVRKSASRAASTGAAGQSTYLSLLDYIQQAGVAVGGINTQYRAEVSQSHRTRQAMWQQARDRASSIQP
jgi:hypothetical protein